MILREIKNIFIKNRLTEGVDFVRKEWLCGDGRAYIDTKITDIRQSEIKVRFRDTNQVTNGSRVLGSETVASSNRLAVTKISGNWNVYDYRAGRKMANGGIVITLDFNAVAKTLSVNGSITNYYPTVSILLDTILLFAQYRRETSSSPVSISGISKVSISYFEIENQINLVPCTLLHAIPTTLDANNIARSAGECGMYDSVSGKFYGNVASTGTFTVEGDVEPETHTGLQQIYQSKLIEGVDYETYDWLRSANGARIGLNYNNNGNFNVELKGKELQTTGTDASQILGTTFAWGSAYLKIAIRKSTGNLMFANNSAVYPSAYQEFELKAINSSDSSFTKVIINGDTYPLDKKYNLQLRSLFYWYNVNYSQHTEGCVGHLKVDNYCNMYPCKLLHPIPRNLDAQCKERVAGECGMIDLISGKFYGNVANSGTFTVENDNNE